MLHERLSKSAKRETVSEEERPRSVSPTRGKRGPNEGLDLKFAFGYVGNIFFFFFRRNCFLILVERFL